MLTIYGIINFGRTKKESEDIILKTRIQHYTKETLQYGKLIAIALLFLFLIIITKYKPLYKVTIDGECVGYIENKQLLEERIQEIANPKTTTIAFVNVTMQPEYELKLVENTQTTNEEEIIQAINNSAIRTFRQYAITLNGEEKACVDTLAEAENLISDMKEEFGDEEIALELAIHEVFSQSITEIETVTLATAKEDINFNIQQLVEEEQKRKESTVEGVYLAVKPVTGNITSRFGSWEDIRDHAHKGIDIAAPNGTAIYAAADGTVSYAGTMGGYGNLVIIDHGNGVQTYYGHCSKLYVKKGETVSAGDNIAAVGSTGNSTGNHLHFEIRLNGAQVNPQKYIYK